MSSNGNRGGRRLRVALASAIAALAVSAIGAASAQAVPYPISFDTGALKISGTNSAIDIVGPADPVTIATDRDAVTGAFDAQPGDFAFTPFTSEVSSTPMVNATVDLIPLEDITGNYNNTTGVLTTAVSDYRADVTLSGDLAAACFYSPIPLGFSTANGSAFFGDVFDAGDPPSNGVVQEDWATLPTPGGPPLCQSLLNALTSGPGGLALGDGVEPALVPPPPPPPATPTPPASTPKKKKCKKGFKKKKVKGKVKCVKKKKKK